jgi:oligopeptidase B
MRVDDWFYYIRTEKDKAYTIYCRKHGSVDAPEEIILDANLLAAGQKYFRLGHVAQSPDHQLLAYSVDLEGDEIFTILVKDLRTGALLSESIPNASYSIEWAADNRTLFYTTLDETLRPYRVFRHELGQSEDALVYEETESGVSVHRFGQPTDQRGPLSPRVGAARHVRSDPAERAGH